MVAHDGPSQVQRTPILEEVYSGAPSRLNEEAEATFSRMVSNRTLSKSDTRKTGLVLPPDTSKEDFERAISDLQSKIGAEHVQINDKPLDDGWYLDHPKTHDSHHITDQETLVASAVVYPGSTEDVQAIVRWANTTGYPLYPISLGRNFGYGGAAPRVPGGIVVDLGKRMHRILDLDGDNASCLVEPGVTYFKLYEAIQERGLPLWIDTPDLGGGSLLGNALDRGVGYTPMGDHWGNHCGFEVVLPNGELLRTGMGALPGPNGADNPTWQSFQHAYGPSIDGIFSQSNFGIVVSMGFHLMPAVNNQSYCITFPEDSDFEQMVEIIRPLAQQRIIGNIPQIRHVVQELAVTGRRKSDFHQGSGPMTREEIRAAASKLPLGDCSWVFYGTQYGPPETINSQLELIKKAFSQIPGSKMFLPKDVPEDHVLHIRSRVCAGNPVLRELDWLNWVPNGGHVAFSPIAPTKGSQARIVNDIITKAFHRHGYDCFSTLCVAGREMHYIAEIVYDRGDPDAKMRAVKCIREMIAECAEHGFGEYRTHLLFQDQVARTYSWGNQALMRFNETLKDALDPNGIIAPGRNGIWPKKYRGKGWELGPNDFDLDNIVPKAK
ncbi:glycolate oxidase [Coniochaeta ligniaria NRRL 30616]|uniref:Glycolate oxidase n=1 Tax=Coniochaeta ligniaria NRRL 30616 TaxID=1408157 RepID=A0A1J7JBD8_9PEZI|nr:glycolate oxidase [Coniochaeta ligniaria NRRL 30616]